MANTYNAKLSMIDAIVKFYYENCMNNPDIVHRYPMNPPIEEFKKVYEKIVAHSIVSGKCWCHFAFDEITIDGLMIVIDYDHCSMYYRNLLRDVLFGPANDGNEWYIALQDFLDEQNACTEYVLTMHSVSTEKDNYIEGNLLDHLLHNVANDSYIIATPHSEDQQELFVDRGFKRYTVNGVNVVRKLGIGKWM